MTWERPDYTYNENFFDHLDRTIRDPNRQPWRLEHRTSNEELNQKLNEIIEYTVRDAMLSFGVEGLARHIEAGGYIGPMLRDFLTRHLRGEKDLLPRGNKRTDAQIQREKLYVYRIFEHMMLKQTSQHAAITALLDREPNLNRKKLEALISKAKKRPRWGLASLHTSVMEAAAKKLSSEIVKKNQAPYIIAVFGGKQLGSPFVTFRKVRSDPKGTKDGNGDLA